ncbi:hypothetical protein [Brumimicrobium mesophilum]|uniref:hypothetical protein n=1 Tax=Brumimicrobium mesophilum TaxID=392717 RepID=UPI000D13EB9E|nr:hypothetical protein [Brumimicrobium mesophilum]
MKKVLFVGMVFGALALTSCKKDYKCTTEVAGVENVETYKDLDKDEADEKKQECETGIVSGTWSVD